MNEKPRLLDTNNTSSYDRHLATKATMTVSTIASAESGDYSNGKENFVTIGNKKVPKLNWKRIDYKDDQHDNRRLLVHRAKNCKCEVCYRELKSYHRLIQFVERLLLGNINLRNAKSGRQND